MPRITLTNNSGSVAVVASRVDTSNGYSINPGDTLDKDVTTAWLEEVSDQLAFLRNVEVNGAPGFDIDVTFDSEDAGEFEFALADTTVWTANHVGFGLEVSAPTTPSVVGARRVDHDAGEAYVGGAFFRVGAGSDVVGDAEILVDGTDVSAVDLVAGEDVYTHFLLVNNAGALETVLVRGESAATGEAEALSRLDLAAAVGLHLGLATASYAYVEAGRILYEESAGLTETVTDYRWVPSSYSND